MPPLYGELRCWKYWCHKFHNEW